MKKIGFSVLALMMAVCMWGCVDGGGEVDHTGSTATTIDTTTIDHETNTTERSHQQQAEDMVWIPRSGAKYHSYSTCSNMKEPRQVILSEAEYLGYTPCKRCY